MPIWADLSHLFGNDIDTTPSGDIAVVTTSDRTTQRVIRRLLSSATTIGNSAYPWEPGYGGGLGAKVGTVADLRAVQAVVLAQLMLEPSVARSPAPTVSVTEPEIGTVQIDTAYTDNSGVQQSFSFTLNPPAQGSNY